ncbi:EAL domain-containing protein [Alteromonas aestuariivivens]|uniref:EAL domain-containing protein n=1 Tax=Alteromonas aestuariivivens TaxID=1938339 RepID=A0A3D8M5N0_9ALTE|nr:EAL domain-containing protein [Alteromonas aestuariivivens]
MVLQDLKNRIQKSSMKCPNSMNIKAFVTSILLLFPLFAVAAPQLPNPYFQVVSSKIGLSQNYINDIKIDPSGFVWIASEGGLDRWDGHSVVNIPGPDSKFVNASIRELFIDDDENLWISTYTSGIYRYDLEANQIEKVIERGRMLSPELFQDAESMIQGPDGTVIIGLWEEVVQYDPRTRSTNVLYSVSENYLQANEGVRYLLLEGSQLFIANSYGLSMVDLAQPSSAAVEIDYWGSATPNERNSNSKYLLMDRKRRLWVGTTQGLFMAPYQEIQNWLRAPETPSPFEQIVAGHNIWQVEETKGNDFWLATNVGLMKLTPANDGSWQTRHILEPHNGDTKLSRTSVLTIAQDDEENLWLGTIYGGALYWSPKSVAITSIQNSRVDKQPRLSNGSVWSFYQSEPDKLWIGTENGLTHYDFAADQSEFYLHNHTEQLSYVIESSIEQILPAPNGKMFLQTLDGIKLFDPATGEALVPPTQDPEHHKVFTDWNWGAQVDNMGRLYFVADDFYRYDPVTQVLESLNLPKERFSPFSFNGFIRAANGYPDKLFLATYDGLWMMDPDTLALELVYQYTEKQINYSVAVTSLVLDHQGILWLSFPRYGLIAVDSEDFSPLPERFLSKDNVLPTNIAYGLQLDDKGNFWFSSHNGLHLYSPVRRSLKNFEYGQEIRMAEFNQGASIQLLDGRFAYGSTQGVVIFDPLKLGQVNNQSLMIRPIVITNLSLESRELDLPMKNLSGRHFALNYDDFGLAIHFSSMLTGKSNRPLYKYQLYRGRELLSMGESRDPKVTFGYLPAGEYRFEVSPKFQPVEYTLLPAQLTFSVPYPPFRSPLYYALYSMIVVVVSLILMIRLKQRKRHWQMTQQQMKLFGEAFQQTRDWVVIFDSQRQPVAVNPAFQQVFNINSNESLDEQLQHLYVRYPNLKRKLRGRIATLLPGEYWKDEDVIEGDNGKHYDVLFDVTAIQNDRDPSQTDHYLIVISDITEQKNAERKLLKMASYDSLTGLVNRTLLLDRLEHAIANAKRHDTRLAVLFVDLDRFKGINDSLGHDYGDKLLKVVANRMLNLASSTDTVARLGGDEFVIVIEEVQGTQDVSDFIGKLIESIELPIKLNRKALRVGCSVGVSFYPDDAVDAASLLNQSDIAMYSAKKDTINRFTFFTQEMNDRAKLRLTLENQVKLAFDEGAFHNFYQPIVNVKTGRVEGLELLLRMSQGRSALGPSQFIPVLEQLRLILDVTRLAIGRAVDDLAGWRTQGFTGYVSVNLSALHFKTEIDIGWLDTLLAERGLTPDALRFEITESVLVDDAENAGREINRLIDAGYKLALDDFGTGYSSLSYLRRFSLQVLKIDKSFVDDINCTTGNDALVLTTIHLASSLSMQSVAEGVESQHQAELLAGMGCYHHQGYYYSKPVPAAKVPGLLQRQWPRFSSVVAHRWAEA